MATTKKKSVKKAISHFITGLRDIKIAVSGKDIKTMGLEPGPIYRQILQAVLEAKLNGELKTRKDELIFIRNYV
jgi:tRNA nucleotidyltransferase (CCA-adding enzyme)